MVDVLWVVPLLAGVGLIVWGAETFAEHLAVASVRLGVSSFALALLLAGAEPEEVATAVTASARDLPAIAFGDVIGANVVVCLVAVGVGAWVAPLPFGPRVRRYALVGLPLGALAAWSSWDGRVSRTEGLFLVAGYVAFVATIWIVERHPPALGETAELTEVSASPPGRVGRELLLVLAGLAAMAVGASVLVEGVRRLSGIEATQSKLGLTVVGFATAFELVVLAWSASRRGMTEAVIAAVIGSFAYNATMTLGAGALTRPLVIADAASLHPAWLAMVASLIAVLAASVGGRIGRRRAAGLLVLYPCFIALVLATT